MRRMDFSTDDKHRATLEMLRQVLDYLERLPPVPITKAFCAELRQHLNEPTQRLLENSRRELHGVFYTTTGIPLLLAMVADDALKLKVPGHVRDNISGEQMAACTEELMRRLLDEGLTIGVRARNGSRGEPW